MRTFAGIPFRVGIIYASAFVVAFWVYSYLWVKAPIMVADSGSYLRAAQDLSDLHMDQLQDRPPGYPVLLLITQSSDSPTRRLFLVSLALHFVSVWLLASVLHRAGLSQPQLILFCFILLLPPYVEAAGYVLSENLAEVELSVGFLGAVLWTLHRRTVWICIASLAVAIAALTRPAYQFLACALVGYLWLSAVLGVAELKSKDLIRGGAILICGSALILGGYAFLNYRSFGRFTVTPRLGLTLSTKTFGVLERLPDEYAPIRAELIRARNQEAAAGQFRPGTTAIWSAVPELTRITGLQRPELSDYMLKLNLLLIRKAPLNFCQEVVWSFGAYWFPSSDALANLNSPVAQGIWAGIHVGVIGGVALTVMLLSGAAAVSVILHGRLRALRTSIGVDRVRLVTFQALVYGLACSVVLYTAVVSCVIELGIPRYRVPTDALIVFMLFVGIELWRQVVYVSDAICSARMNHSGAHLAARA